MDILLQFYIEKKDNNKFLFWSCVLNTYLDQVDFDYINRDSIIKIENFSNYTLNINYKKWDNFEDLVKVTSNEYNKKYFIERPEYFLGNDKTFKKGSPYKSASCLVKTYYQNPEKFIYNLKEFLNNNYTDYEINTFIRNIINGIEKNLGINIFKNESVPGGLSIYSKLSSFEIDGYFNPDRGDRYIKVIPINDNMDSNFKDALIEIELTDNEKILSKRLYTLNDKNSYNFPIKDDLEPFSQFNITIYEKTNNNNEIYYEKIFKEKFSLIRKVLFSMGASGGNSKIVKTRYIHNKDEEKITLSDYHNFTSGDLKDIWLDWENDLKDFIYGRKKEYLESKYFEKSQKGREEFLEWVRSKVRTSKKVTIVDPYFDQQGVDDFSSCIDTNPEIIIITTNPEEKPRDDNVTKEVLVKLIQNHFNKVEIFITPKDKFHDRYFILENDDSSYFYNMSNSWNGTVNKYSLLIQEIPLEKALQISDEINEYRNNANEEKRNIQKENKKDEEDGIQILINIFHSRNIKIIKKEDSIFSEIDKELKEIEKYDLKEICKEIIKKLLEKQKNKFIEKQRFIEGKSIRFYSSPEKAIDNINHRINFSFRFEYELDLDYALSKILEKIFYIIPEETIETLQELEQEICIIDTGDDKKKYYMSEVIISYYLGNLYWDSNKNLEELIIFANKIAKYSYPKLYLAKTIFQKNKNISFSDLFDKLKKLQLSDIDKYFLLIDFLNEIKRFNKDKVNDYVIAFEKSIFIYFDDLKLSNNEKLKFAYKIYIHPYELDLEGLKKYIDYLEMNNQNELAKKIENILLFKSLETNKELMNKVIILVDDSNRNIYFDIINGDDIDKNYSDIDIRKYKNYIFKFSEIFSQRLIEKNDIDKLKNIINQIKTNKILIFNLDYFPEKMSLYYYDAIFILNTLYQLKNKCSDKIKNNILNYFKWYLPACLTSYSEDFYGLSIILIDLLTTLLNDNDKKQFVKNTFDKKSKILILSSLDNQVDEYIKEYSIFFDEKYKIENNDNGKSIMIFLNVFINLCIKTSFFENKHKYIILLESLNNKFKKMLSENINNILKYGFIYTNEPNNENKKIFIDSMKDSYLPYSALCLEEAEDEK